MKNSTWYDLADHFCAREKSLLDDGANQYFERFAARRYNYAASSSISAIRLVFLASAATAPENKTLVRDGRFIWCKNLRFEGVDDCNLRKLSFTIANGKKRFYVSERDVLALPHTVFINNNSFFKNYEKVFSSFSSVFSYRESLRMMKNSDGYDWESLEEFSNYVNSYTPFQPGTLVRPRLGLFIPRIDKLKEKVSELSAKYCTESTLSHKKADLIAYLSGRDYVTTDKDLLSLFRGFHEWCSEETSAIHPVGIVLGKARNISPHSGKELYRVSFAETIYEEIHPIQLEVIGEV
tara:strand:- start:1649 stop:2530 length:882 start_codon:yes stop_codon:yes gene_type:complete